MIITGFFFSNSSALNSFLLIFITKPLPCFFKLITFSHRPFFSHHNLHRLEQDPKIKSHTPFAYILFVQLYNFFKVCNIASSADLPHSGKARFDCEAGTVVEFVFFPFVQCWRPGSDQGHIAF